MSSVRFDAAIESPSADSDLILGDLNVQYKVLVPLSDYAYYSKLINIINILYVLSIKICARSHKV